MTRRLRQLRWDAQWWRALARLRGRLDRSPRLAFGGDYPIGPGPEEAATAGSRTALEVVAGL